MEDDEILAKLDAIVEQAKREGFVVPPSFRTLWSNRDLYNRIPTCTSCYVDLPDRLVAIEGEPGRLLRFMNDQQCCLVWCLHLFPGGGHEVVAAAPRFDEGARGETLEDVASFVDHVVCADDFEEFVHRFWLENVLWNASNRERELTPEEAAYVAHARNHRA